MFDYIVGLSTLFASGITVIGGVKVGYSAYLERIVTAATTNTTQIATRACYLNGPQSGNLPPWVYLLLTGIVMLIIGLTWLGTIWSAYYYRKRDQSPVVSGIFRAFQASSGFFTLAFIFLLLRGIDILDKWDHLKNPTNMGGRCQTAYDLILTGVIVGTSTLGLLALGVLASDGIWQQTSKFLTMGAMRKPRKLAPEPSQSRADEAYVLNENRRKPYSNYERP
jgi:hypothetical protein